MIEPMNCPSCNHKLSNVTIAQVLINVCEEGCGGIWLDRGELPKISSSGDSIMEKVLPIKNKNYTKHDQPRKCPRDHMLLKKKSFMEEQAVVDECPQCAGIWIDNLEEFLQVVSDFKQKKNLDRTQIQTYFEKGIKDRIGEVHVSINQNRYGGSGAAIVGSSKVIGDTIVNNQQGGISNILGKRAVLEAIFIPIIILLLIIAYGYFYK